MALHSKMQGHWRKARLRGGLLTMRSWWGWGCAGDKGAASTQLCWKSVSQNPHPMQFRGEGSRNLPEEEHAWGLEGGSKAVDKTL